MKPVSSEYVRLRGRCEALREQADRVMKHSDDLHKRHLAVRERQVARKRNRTLAATSSRA